MINTQGYRHLKDFVDEYLSGLQRADEKYKFDKNLIIKHCINCLIKIGGNIYQKDLLPLKLVITNHTTVLPDTIGIIEGVFRTDHLYSSRLFKLPYSNQSNMTNYLQIDNRISNDCYSYRVNSTDSYYVSFPYIHTSFKEGHIFVDYRAIKTDEDGLIIYPAYPEIEEALKWYVSFEMFFEAYLMDDINQNKHEDLKNKRDNALLEARGKNAFPSKEEAISFLSSINRRFDQFKLRKNSNGYNDYFR